MTRSNPVARRFRNIRRLNQIVGVFVRHGFGDVISRLRLDTVRGGRAGEPPVDGVESGGRRVSAERRIRLAFEELGPTFVKLGQVLATRPDLIPAGLVFELAKLHDEVPPFPAERVLEVLKEDFGASADELFSEFEEEAVAAASIAQVHRARLRDGRAVAVKVQRPGLREIIDTDLDILRGLAELLEEQVEEARMLRPVAVVDEFTTALAQELDFQNEVRNLQRFRRNFLESEDAVVPEAIEDLCSARVITMEWMDGFKVTDREAILARGLDPMEVARRGTLVMMESIFEHGFFHADPHPGNFLVQDDGTMCLLDFGLTGEIDSTRIDELLGFLNAVLLNDVDMLISQLEEMDILLDIQEPRRLRHELNRLLNRFQGTRLEEMDAAKILGEVFEVVRSQDVSLPSDLLLVLKAIGTAEGIAAEICPEFQPIEEVRPYLVRIYTKRVLDPHHHSKLLARTLGDGVSLLRTLPRDLRQALRRLNRGELKLDARGGEGEADRRQRDGAVNRIILALLLCTFVGVTTLLLYVPPEASGVLRWIGFGFGALTSAALFATLVWSIFRSHGP